MDSTGAGWSACSARACSGTTCVRATSARCCAAGPSSRPTWRSAGWRWWAMQPVPGCRGCAAVPRRIRDRVAVARAWLRGETSTIPGPAVLAIETTVRCNLRCPMCPRTGAGYPAEDMPDAMLWRLLDEHAALGGDLVWLNGLGEPFLDARLFDVLARCRELGLGTVVATNGTRLTAEHRRRLLEVGCDQLLVSIEGVTERTYRHHRPGGRLAEVEAAVRSLAAEKRAAGSRMVLAVQMVRMPRTIPEEDAFLARWRSVPGVDLVRLKDEEFGAEGYELARSDAPLRHSPCRILWTGPLIVRWNGDVAACHPRAARRMHLGNLHEHSLLELWTGPEARRLRRIHAERRAGEDPRCAECPVSRPRRPYVLAAMSVRAGTVQRAIPIAEHVSRRWGLPFLENRRG
ncbi:MAG: radical SAM protein [Deltaproteobacteria bacterium]|nr:MAG: radical SAM protein [Deltaproteobacteria bacterium]